MKYCKTFKPIFQYLIIAAAFISALFYASSQARAYDTSVPYFLSTQSYNNLISDDAFLAVNSMTVDDIQRFLLVKGSYLAGYSENGRSAAQIIYDAAHAFTTDSQSPAGWRPNGIPEINASTGTINPKAILVILDKEQSLISGKFRLPGQGDFTNTSALQYAMTWAMGYGCPDSGEHYTQ